jgi:L-serine dehydratase
VGGVIAARATLSGAEGGCQAEVGSASAMAAAALTEMMGGAPAACAQACAIALSNLMGLICDPVAGLVEVPCVNRNVIGAVGAVAAAEMALLGIVHPIPADEVIDAMGRVGATLPPALRETGEGGLAATPEGRRIRERLTGR